MASNKTTSKPTTRTVRVDKILRRFPETSGALFTHKLESGEWLNFIGSLPEDVDEGDSLIVVGKLNQHPKYGAQFNIQFVLAHGIGPLTIDPNKIAQVMAIHELDRELSAGHCYELLHTIAVKVSDTLGLTHAEALERLTVQLGLIVVHGKRVLKSDIDAAEILIADAIRGAIHGA